MKKPSKKTILSALSALFIGILGCALWEYIFSPLCKFVYIKISSLIDKFSATFSNSTYIEISKGYYDSPVIDIVCFIIIIFFIYISSIFYLYLTRKSQHKLTSEEKFPYEYLKRNFFIRIIILISTQLVMIIWMYWIGNLMFINQCKSTSLCNLEIISPYISDLEYKELKSDFYSIQTKADYESFVNTINELGEKYSLNLK